MRILLSRTDRIGDLVLSTPAIATVRASFPDAHVTLVASAYNRVVVERNSDVDTIVTLDRPEEASAVGRRVSGYDVAIALAPRVIDLRVVRASGAPRRFGYTYRRRWIARLTAPLYVSAMMLSEADPALSERNPKLHVRHEVEQLLDLVAVAGAQHRVEQLRLDVRDEDRRALDALPERPIVLHLGLRWFRDGSTLASTQELLRGLSSLGYPIVVTTPRESLAYAEALESSKSADAILRDLPFFQWAAAFERAACVVTVDTAATHVASAMRRPTLVAFEHRYFELNSQEWAPYGVPNVLVRKPPYEEPAALARFRDEIVEGVAQLIHA